MTTATLDRITTNFHPLHQPQIILGQTETSQSLVYPNGKIVEIKKSRRVIRLEIAYEEAQRQVNAAKTAAPSALEELRNKRRDLHTKLHEERRALLYSYGVHLDGDDKMHVVQDHEYHRQYCLICVPA